MLIRDKHIDPTAVFLKRIMTIGVAPAQSLTNAVIQLIKMPRSIITGAGLFHRTYTATLGVDLRIVGATALIIPGLLAIDAVPEKFKLITDTVVYTVGGVVKTKAPATAIAFSAAHKITALTHGAVLVQVNASGTVSTKVVAATQAYATAQLAISNLPLADTNEVAVGYILIEAGAADWDAQTDDLVAASDLTAVTFVNYGVRKPLTGAIAPVANSEVAGVVSATAITSDQVTIEDDEYLAVIATTDGNYAGTDGRLNVHYRPVGMRGEA